MTIGRNIGTLMTLAMSCVVFTTCDNDTKCCECLKNEGKSDKYNYPIVPGTPEWSELTTAEEIYDACQIPTNVLADICPVGLVDSWLTYPLRSNIFTWSTPQFGLERITENFNGLHELLNRPTSSEVLLERYQSFDPSGYEASATSVEKGKYAVDLFVLELTLAQFHIIDNLSEAQLMELVNEALGKRIVKLEDQVYHSDSDPDALAHSSDVYIMAHAMIHNNYEPFTVELQTGDLELKHFVDTGQYIYPTGTATPAADLMVIVNHAKDFVGN